MSQLRDRGCLSVGMHATRVCRSAATTVKHRVLVIGGGERDDHFAQTKHETFPTRFWWIECSEPSKHRVAVLFYPVILSH